MSKINANHGRPLVMGDDGGGWRQCLAGEPISCGSILELQEHAWRQYRDARGDTQEEFVPTGTWTIVRYEVAGKRDPKSDRTIRVPMMHKNVGGYEFTCPIGDHHKFRWPKREG